MTTNRIFTIDGHTCGEPIRVVVGGMPIIRGKTMMEKKFYLQEHCDNIRKSIMLEPRGHRNMFGSLITEPCNDQADFGVIFMDTGGYLNMCGHGTIGTVTAALEAGIVKAKGSEARVNIDTPSGLIKTFSTIENGRVESVRFANVPSFLYKVDQEAEVEGYGKIKFDIAFAGSFFALVDAGHLGIEIEPNNAHKFQVLGMKLLEIINKEIKVQHPTIDQIKTVDLVEFYDKCYEGDADIKNVVIFGASQFDRSPCGTGTSAKLATLYTKGELAINQTIVNKSILGTKFKGKVVEKTKVGVYDAIIPEVTGSAYVIGYNQIIIDDSDPLKDGFLL